MPSAPALTLLFLGTGTSYGIPMLTCTCPVCTSPDPRDRRLRTAVLFQTPSTRLLLDTPPDLRTQCLQYKIPSLDGVLLSHDHTDHLSGFDDLRPYSRHADAPLPVFASPGTAAAVRAKFGHVFRPPVPGTTIAHIDLRPVLPDPSASIPFRDLLLTPLPVAHGRADMVGWKIAAGPATAAIISDCKTIPPPTLDACRGLDLLVLDCLRLESHPTHMNLDEVLAVVSLLRPRQTLFVHMCHHISHARLASLCPPSVSPAHDGLSVALP